MLSVEHMTADVSFQEFGHQAVHGPTGSAHDLQDFGAVALLSKGSHESFDLPLNALGWQISFCLSLIVWLMVQRPSASYHTGYGI